MGTGKILFITVGTGDIERLEESLFTPLRKSIRRGEWQEVVLLPSRETAHTASRLQKELADLRIVMAPCPNPIWRTTRTRAMPTSRGLSPSGSPPEHRRSRWWPTSPGAPRR